MKKMRNIIKNNLLFFTLIIVLICFFAIIKCEISNKSDKVFEIPQYPYNKIPTTTTIIGSTTITNTIGSTTTTIISSTTTLVSCTNFKGPYASITTAPYSSTFQGTTSILQIRNAITVSSHDFSSQNYQIMAVITGFENDGSGSFTSNSYFFQDATAGIYFYRRSGSTPITVNDLGKVITGKALSGRLYSGNLKEINEISNANISSPGYPTAIYLKDITTASASNDGMIVRYNSTVQSNISGIINFSTSVPRIKGISGDTIGNIGDNLLVIGPQTTDYSTGNIQIETVTAYPKSNSTYICK